MTRKKATCEPIGSFKVESKELVVSDPCYELGTWCAGTLSKPKPGVWKAFIVEGDLGEWGTRIMRLLICHKSEKIDKRRRWRQEDIDVGVDSGQAGFFDIEWFRKSKKVVKSDYGKGERVHQKESAFYAACCSHTLTGKRAGCLSHGVVCSSGIGDGSYVCYTHRNRSREVDAAFIDFSGHILL